MSDDEFESLADGSWKYEIESLRQQLSESKAELNEFRKNAKVGFDRQLRDQQKLAAALAACKEKDEVIKQASNYIDVLGGYSKQHRQALSIQPDDSALKAWLGEPVAWRYESATGVYRYRGYVENFDTDYKLLKPIPLYAPKGMK